MTFKKNGEEVQGSRVFGKEDHQQAVTLTARTVLLDDEVIYR
jgi:hypothetical protein